MIIAKLVLTGGDLDAKLYITHYQILGGTQRQQKLHILHIPHYCCGGRNSPLCINIALTL